MGLMHAWLLLLLFHSVCSYQVRSGARYGLFVHNPDLEWARMETSDGISEEMAEVPAPKHKFWKRAPVSQPSAPVAKKFPQYLIVSPSEDEKEVFKPQIGARPLPDWAVRMLLGNPSNILTTESLTDPSEVVEILCHLDRMYVRIKREVFKTIDAYKYLKLGTCPVNQGTSVYYYFLYLLKTDCGFKQESKADYVYISNVLRYEPTGPVLREMPFVIPLQCNFPRSFYSYEVGFYPEIQAQTVFMALGQKSSFTLTPQDATGNEITGGKTYTIGETMYFEAKQVEDTEDFDDQRIYINNCFMTASRDPNSNPQYTIIDNQGCMFDGKVTGQSKFLTGELQTTQKFSVAAFIFKSVASTSSSQILFMHCEINMGELTPTPSSKACNYDPATKTWVELYGDNSVCTCCESSCPSAQPRAYKTMISSHSWKVDLIDKSEYVGVDPQMEPSDNDLFSLEDPYLTETS